MLVSVLTLVVFAAAPSDSLEARCNALSMTDDGHSAPLFEYCMSHDGARKPEPPSTPMTPDDYKRLEERRQYYASLDTERDAAEEAATKLQKKCGQDYHRVQVGMSFSRVLKCSSDFPDAFELKYEDEHAKVYESEGGLVRVEHGKITRTWHSR